MKLPELPEDDPNDWIPFSVGLAIAGLALIAPLLVFFFGAPIVEWTLFSWELYLVLLTSVAYIVGYGVVFERIRRND